MATPRASRRLAPGDGPRVTPAVGPVSSRTAQFNLSSGAATAVVFVSILLCFILLCSYCRCARQRAIASARRRVIRELVPGAALLLRPAGGALPPETSYAGARAAAKKGQGLPEDCPVCLEPFADDDGVRMVPACGHLYHTPCIDRWLDEHNSCPVCRCAVVYLYAADGGARDAAVAGGGEGVAVADDQEAVLERVVAMIEAIREEQRVEEATRRSALASAAGDGG